MEQIIKSLSRLVPANHTVSALTHVRITDDQIIGGNGRVQLRCPTTDFAGFDITVPGKKMFAALIQCGDDINMHLTEKRLTISKKGFRAYMPLLPSEEYPVFDVIPATVELPTNFLDILKLMFNFIGNDASRPWACGIYFDKQYAYATNNVVFARMPLTVDHAFNLPIFTVDMLLKAEYAPTRLGIADNTISFYFDDGSILTSNLLEGQWPDTSKLIQDNIDTPIPQGMLQAVQSVLPFCDNEILPRITFKDDLVQTDEGDMGATVSFTDVPPSSFNGNYLSLVLENSTHYDFTPYPKPCYFKNEHTGLAGALVGLRK